MIYHIKQYTRRVSSDICHKAIKASADPTSDLSHKQIEDLGLDRGRTQPNSEIQSPHPTPAHAVPPAWGRLGWDAGVGVRNLAEASI